MAEYAKPFERIPRLLDATDSLGMNYTNRPWKWHERSSWAALAEKDRVCRYETKMQSWFDRVFVTSPTDAAFMRTTDNSDNIVILPNGVDLQRFYPDTTPVDPFRVILTGKLDYFPNTDAALHFARVIFREIKKKVPKARFVIVGFNPPRAVRRLEQIEGVTVLGNVIDLRLEIAQSAVSVAPLRFGAGMQNKVLEALATGVPVVCTKAIARPITLGYTDTGILEADTVSDFAKQVVHLLNDPQHRATLGRLGREWVTRHFSWEDALRPLDRIIEEIESQREAAASTNCVS